MIFYAENLYISSKIRGEQILTRYPNLHTMAKDKVIAIKTILANYTKPYYLDVVDALPDPAQITKGTTLIAITSLGQKFLEERYSNPVILLPQHHCNFDNELRTRTSVTTLGYCGDKVHLQGEPPNLKKLLVRYDTKREEVIEFYKQIDINFSFRLPPFSAIHPPELRNPLKLINAGSFKIPTISYPEPILLAECPDAFLPARTIQQAQDWYHKLQEDPALYIEYANRAYEYAQQFHIDKIVQEYINLASS